MQDVPDDETVDERMRRKENKLFWNQLMLISLWSLLIWQVVSELVHLHQDTDEFLNSYKDAD